MELHITLSGSRDLAKQITEQLREAITLGTLAAGTRLPPTRLLAEQLGVSRKTVADAYSHLTYDNLLVGRVGAGTFVNRHVPHATQPIQANELAGAAVIQHWRDAAMPMHHPTHTLRYDYLGGATGKHQFPEEEWRRCMLFALRQGAQSRGLYGQPEGLPMLREAIARHIGFSRGVRCNSDDLLVTNGAQQALDLIARVLVEPGCTVVVEDPGYPPARLLFAAQGARVVGVAVDDQGLRVDLIPEGTRLIYVTPAHQFPLGMPMSPARRLALLERARELGAIIIEDDYDCEFRYEGRPTDCLQSLDRRLPSGDPRQGPAGHPAADRTGETGRNRPVPAGPLLLHRRAPQRPADGLRLHRDPGYPAIAGPATGTAQTDGLNRPARARAIYFAYDTNL